jgi:hypothetical protein
MKDRDVCKAHSGDADVGQPSKLTAAVRDQIAGYIRQGVPKKYAAQATGIAEATLYHWVEVGEADAEQGKVTAHSEFLESIVRARAEFLAANAMIVQRAARGYETTVATKDGGEKTIVVEGDWRAATWLLERQGGTEWAPSQDLRVSGELRRDAPEVPADDQRMRALVKIGREIGVLPTE